MIDERAARTIAHCDNTGRWGTEDQFGTLNHIDDAKRRDAAAEIQTGQLVSLGRPLGVTLGKSPGWHKVRFSESQPYMTLDTFQIDPHGLHDTHIDALGHIFLDGSGYGGRSQSSIVDGDRLMALDVAAMAEGIVTRGVLLDVSNSPLESDRQVTRRMLEAAAKATGVTSWGGDAIFIYSGAGPDVSLSLDAIEWLFDTDVAVLGGDCSDKSPISAGDEGLPMPVHQIGLARMGLALVDGANMEPLVQLAQALSRSTFMIAITPLRFAGATGSPVNPIAIF